MKKLCWLIFLTAGIVSTDTYGQCTPLLCLDSPNVLEFGGVCDSALDNAIINTAYTEAVSFFVKGTCFDAGQFDSTRAGTNVRINRLNNIVFSGFPGGISAGTNATTYNIANGATVAGCAWFAGTPTQAGKFNTTISIDGRAVLCAFPLISVTQTIPYNLEFTVLPNAGFAGLGTQYCTTDGPVTLTVTGTTGGTFSGPGVSGNTFDPELAGPGLHTITYTVSAQQGTAYAPATNSSSVTVTVNAGTIYYVDFDLDGFGNSTAFGQEFCSFPGSGYSANNGDCNDQDSDIHPGASEVPCNGVDENCNGQTDENSVFVTYYLDADLDGYGNSSQSQSTCNGAPVGYVTTGGDCNDQNAEIHPGASEVPCNGVDENCNGQTDENSVFVTYYLDADLDGYGNSSQSQSTCNGAPGGYVTTGGDCNDQNAEIHPGASEVSCNGVDENCNGQTDENSVFVTYYFDNDLDGYGNSSLSQTTCNGAPIGYVALGGDCDELDQSINPGVLEMPCNDTDDNCNGQVDENSVFVTYYFDNDLDGYGNPSLSETTCNGAPDGYIITGGDCNDQDEFINPGVEEVDCNEIDDNCDGRVDEFAVYVTYYLDEDQDGYGNSLQPKITCNGRPLGYSTENGDCDDQNSSAYPGALEILCNGIDEDCDGIIDDGLVDTTYYLDIDDDGFGDISEPIITCLGKPANAVENGLDCNDNNADINPDATEIPCNGIDENCDGTIDENSVFVTYYFDGDNDGYGNINEPTTKCDGQPANYSENGLDCNDNDADIHPDATEVPCNGIDDNCNGSIDENSIFVTYYFDGDNDGFGNISEPITKCDGQPTNYVENGFDCNDNDANINPDATEISCNGIDDNCNGQTDEGSILTTWYLDNDGDDYINAEESIEACTQPIGYLSIEQSLGYDCDDSDPDKYNVRRYVEDTDGDGFGAFWEPDGDYSNTIIVCGNTPPAGYIPVTIPVIVDCDDNDPGVYPGATEIPCNGIDEDCDGIDEGSPVKYFRDDDEDGYGNTGFPYVLSCDGQPDGYVTDSTDCDDTSPLINPGMAEIPCNGLDDNCNGQFDENGPTPTQYYEDRDGDGYGRPNSITFSCDGAPDGYVANNSDCDDNNDSIYREEVLFVDRDGDNYFNETEPIVILCIGTDIPAGYVYLTEFPDPFLLDCNDNDPNVNAGKAEVACNGIDDNCNGEIDEIPGAFVNADLMVEKVADSTTVIAGQEAISYIITINNNGLCDASNVKFKDQLPAGTQLISFNPAVGWGIDLSDLGNGVIKASKLSLSTDNGPQIFQISVSVSGSFRTNEIIRNTVMVSGDTPDSNMANNFAFADVTVNTVSDLSISKSAPDSVLAGSDLSYTITVVNNGPSDAYDITLIDRLPPGTTLVSVTSPSEWGSDIYYGNNPSDEIPEVYGTRLIPMPLSPDWNIFSPASPIFGQDLEVAIANLHLPPGITSITLVLNVSGELQDGHLLTNQCELIGDVSSELNDPDLSNNSSETSTTVIREIDCEVSAWGNWSECSAVCGGGTQIRTRTVTTEPANGGAACPVLEEQQACNEQPCAIDCAVSDWSNWGECSEVCGGGVQIRTRTVTTEPANGGAACPVLEEQQACNEQPCPVDCIGEWSNWSECSVLCGGGIQTRTFHVIVPAQNGGIACAFQEGYIEQRICNREPCCNNKWITGEWGECSEACGAGTQLRTVVCQDCEGNTLPDGSCQGLKPLSTQSCNNGPCPVDCAVSDWSSWSECSVVCGGGVQIRTRTVTTEPANGGAACPVLTEQQACNEQPCPVDCVVSSWSEWSTCSVLCDGGIETRTRTVITPPSNGGAACPDLVETRTCNEQPCSGCNNAPAKPAKIYGKKRRICLGNTSIYSIDPVPTATSYIWSVTNGASIFSGQGSTQVTVKFPQSLVSYVELKVRAVNDCGQGPVKRYGGIWSFNTCGAIIVGEESENETSEDMRSGIANLAVDMEVDVYPNPSSGNVFVGISGISDIEDVRIRILNMQGKELSNTSYKVAGERTIQLNLKDLPDGIYLLEATGAQSRKMIKLVKD